MAMEAATNTANTITTNFNTNTTTNANANSNTITNTTNASTITNNTTNTSTILSHTTTNTSAQPDIESDDDGFGESVEFRANALHALGNLCFRPDLRAFILRHHVPDLLRIAGRAREPGGALRKAATRVLAICGARRELEASALCPPFAPARSTGAPGDGRAGGAACSGFGSWYRTGSGIYRNGDDVGASGGGGVIGGGGVCGGGRGSGGGGCGGIRILSIDGGGSRGVIAIEILKALEGRLRAPLGETFDLICGKGAATLVLNVGLAAVSSALIEMCALPSCV
jgi:hypothetical protein